MVNETLLCFRLTTDTGSVIELWELDSGAFELLFAEAHCPANVVHTVTLDPVEAALFSEKLAMAADAYTQEER